MKDDSITDLLYSNVDIVCACGHRGGQHNGFYPHQCGITSETDSCPCSKFRSIEPNDVMKNLCSR